MPRRDEGEPISPRVEDRVVEVLQESSGRLAFGGLRRALDVHPESLSRALRRLVRDGLIRKGDGGYELLSPVREEIDPSPRPDVRTVAAVELPPGETREGLFGRLSGRWFGALRWVGVFDYPGDPWLVWSVEGTSAHVMLSARARQLRVLAEKSKREPEERVEDAAYELLSHAVSGLRVVSRSGTPSVVFLTRPPIDARGTDN